MQGSPGGESVLRIARVGDAGDGVATDGHGQKHYFPRTLPGEDVQLAARGGPTSVLQPSPDRITPPCPHFAEGCGGCAVQHWSAEACAGWKRDRVVASLHRAGFAAGITAPLIRLPAGSRRRMDFAARRLPGRVLFGLHAARGTDIVDLHVCHVLSPALASLLAPLRALLGGLGGFRRDASVLVNQLDGGLDLLIRTDGPLAASDRTKLAAWAQAHGVLRVSWAAAAAGPAAPPETVAQLAPALVSLGGHAVEVPAGAFLQASAEGEAAIVGALLAGVPDRLPPRSHAVELYAGLGTLSFPLATRLRVLAFEGDKAAAQAVRRAQAGSRVEMTWRDLARQPLDAKALAAAALVLLDPPYGGAAEQCRLIAAARVPRVIYVSCNPAALARDAAPLAEAGYTLLAATPIDQFVWSAAVECVAVFGRAGEGRRATRVQAGQRASSDAS